MTFKEFLEFITQSPGYFVGFLFVFGILVNFGFEVLNSLFKNVFKPLIKGLFKEEMKEKEE